MQTVSASRPASRLGSIVGRTLFGATLVAAGLGFVFLVIETPLIVRLVPASGGSFQLAAAVFIWMLALVAGAGLSIAGMNRLAATMAAVRSGATAGPPVTRLRSRLPADIVATVGVVPDGGRPIPELVVGPFGIAVVHELGPREIIRSVGSGWERRTSRGWVPVEYPVERVNRDAERIRHWLNTGDMDFVVRVYAALVTTDQHIPRSPVCAVISPDQIPAWFEALPVQRSMTAARRGRLLDRVRAAPARR
jgi:hypothetical protein